MPDGVLQWIDPAGGRADVEVEGAVGPVEVVVRTQDRVHESDVEYAFEKLGAALRRIDEPVQFVRLKLGVAGDPARIRPALAQVTVDIDGDLVRAQVAGHTMREAIDLLQRRLVRQLEQRADRREFLRTRGTGKPGVWRRGDLATERPPYYDRPREERELVRQKTFAIDELTVDEAAFDMDQLDFDFYLFCDVTSGEDALLERLADGTYRLTRLHPSAIDPGPTAVEVTIADTAPPELTVPDAVELLDATGEPFVFFADATTGRGNVVYRRYDGNYGLVTPA
jgi:ribosome-associated translation inhibitor RaiA